MGGGRLFKGGAYYKFSALGGALIRSGALVLSWVLIRAFTVFLVFTHVMRCWCIKQCQNAAQVLHNNRIKFPKYVHGRRDVTSKPRIVKRFSKSLL